MDSKQGSEVKKKASPKKRRIQAINEILKVHDHMSASLPGLFQRAKDIHKGKKISQDDLKFMIANVNLFIFHCSMLCVPFFPDLPNEIKVDELCHTLEILEDIQRILYNEINKAGIYE